MVESSNGWRARCYELDHSDNPGEKGRLLELQALLEWLPRRILRMSRYCNLRLQLVWLTLLNRYSRRAITSADGPVLSLTTYSKRIHSAYLTIESVGRGKALPSRNYSLA